jgi:hypothetical protein
MVNNLPNLNVLLIFLVFCVVLLCFFTFSVPCDLCLFAYSGVQHILCCVFALFFFIYVASVSRLSFFGCPFGIL